MGRDLDRYARADIKPYIPTQENVANQVIEQLRAQGQEPVVIVVKDQKAPDHYQVSSRDKTGMVFVFCAMLAIIVIVAIIAVACANAPVINPPAHNNPSCILFCQ